MPMDADLWEVTPLFKKTFRQNIAANRRAQPEQGSFGKEFGKIGQDREGTQTLQVLLRLTEEFLRRPFGELNYQWLTDQLLALPNAKFCAISYSLWQLFAPKNPERKNSGIAT